VTSVGPSADDRPDTPETEPAVETGADAVPPAELEWRRLHPVTPLVRGWAVLAVILFMVGRQSIESMPEGDMSLATDHWGFVVLGILGVGLVGGVWAWLSWRMTRYAYDRDAVYVHSGILFRQQRKVRLDRLQAVDIVKPLLARFFGLAELKLSVAGGGDSGARLGFLRDADANQLRNLLLARAAGVETADGTDPVEEAPENAVLEVPVGRLVGSVLLNAATIVLLVGVVAAVTTAVVIRQVAPLFTVLPIVFGLGAYVFSRFSGGFGFTGAISPDGIRLRHGLLETRSQTIPPGRVQAIRIQQGLLWRAAGYAESTDGEQAGAVLLPVGSRDDALRALWLVLPDLGADDPTAVLDALLSGSGDDLGFVTSPRRARWLDPLAWRRNGYAVTGRALLIRRGRLVRTAEVVPHERTQSLGLDQGPLQRRLGLTSFVLHSTPGPIGPRVVHLGDDEASRLLADQASRARAARTSAGPERWMQAAG
jgi:putative membrane protein